MIDKRQQTKWRKLPDGRIMRVFHGMSYIRGNAHPYFSITGEIYRPYTGGSLYGSIIGGGHRYSEDSFGCLHEDIKTHFPELAPLIKFHLWDQNGLPMYYVANGLYWLKKAHGVFKVFPHSEPEGRRAGEPEPEQVFRSHCLLETGLLPSLENIMPWFESRKPLLQKEFHDIMTKFSIEYIKEVKYV